MTATEGNVSPGLFLAIVARPEATTATPGLSKAWAAEILQDTRWQTRVE